MAEDETPIEEKKKRKRRTPKSFGIGRQLAWLKRSKPELVEDLTDYARASGKKPTQVIEEALNHYIYQRPVSYTHLTLPTTPYV